MAWRLKLRRAVVSMGGDFVVTDESLEERLHAFHALFYEDGIDLSR
jgi:hypothetical protein